METKRISEKEIKGLPVLATGYKMFKNDWTTKYGTYDYKDENGNILGSIHKVEGELKECEWGFHFSKKPQDCFNFYECVQWNTFAKVEAFGNSVDSKDGNKSVASIIRIVEIYSFDEFIDLIQKELQNRDIRGGNDIRSGNDIRGGDDIVGGNYIRGGNHIIGGNNIYFSRKLRAASKCIFCFDLEGCKLMLFNKKISQERFNKVKNELCNFSWYPKFNNAEELRGNLAWHETNIPAIVNIENKIAYSSMPQDMVDYIRSLPEFDEKIFNKIIN